MTANPLDRRADERRDFLRAAGWSRAAATPLAGDASTRSYERLFMGAQRAVLMNAPPAAEGAACPLDAPPAVRRRLGYNAMARLAGPNLNAFAAIAETLRGIGLSAPQIFHLDAQTGFALIEDMGDDLFARAIPKGAPEDQLYKTAVDALLRLREAAPPPPASASYTMLAYDQTALEAETMLIIDWYWPFFKGESAGDDLKAEYLAAWSYLLNSLTAPTTMILRDYHAENLLWLPERTGFARAGMIDFQDGLIGHGAYDLVSLLEDARRDVDPTLAESMVRRYERGAAAIKDFHTDAFRREYAILGAQRNAKIMGIFARLVTRDGKKRYAELMPRVERHFLGDLRHPDLAPVARFFRRHFPEKF